MEGIIKKHNEELRSFYLPFFLDEKELEGFLSKVYNMDWNENIPRQMINQIRRFVILSQRIEEIYPPRDGLRLMFLKICMESLCHLDISVKKKDFYNIFAECFSNEATNYILANFKLFECYSKDSESVGLRYGDLTISDILEIIKHIRDQVVHDGVFWNFQMFANDTESQWLTCIETNENIIKSVEDYSKSKCLVYHFETTLQFDIFTHYFTEACINYVNRYMEENKKE